MNYRNVISVITPTTGKSSLNKLITSLKRQRENVIEHILLWDERRDLNVLPLKDYDEDTDRYKAYSIEIPGKFVFGSAAGSALRSIGMMAARGTYVTFADDDVWFEDTHFDVLKLGMLEQKASWGFCKRKIWHAGEYLGIDEFESVGMLPTRKVPYEMVDNNSMMFARRLGTSAACLYRETTDYNDDRLMYGFLKAHGGTPAVVDSATVNQVCPDRLVEFFRINCTKVT